MERLIDDMVAEAERLGALPAGNRKTLRDSVTIERGLNVVLLWYNMGADTRVLVRRIADPDDRPETGPETSAS